MVYQYYINVILFVHDTVTNDDSTDEFLFNSLLNIEYATYYSLLLQCIIWYNIAVSVLSAGKIYI